MDKRTLLFVVSLSLTLFMVNIFFSQQDQERKREWYKQQEAIQAKKKEEAPQATVAQSEASKLPVTQTPEWTAVKETVVSEEKFFVLENEYQQLLFSNKGAALVEINLPFQTESNPLSSVLEIEFDREMVEKHPSNAQFPARPYFTAGANAAGPHEQHAAGVLGGYYPLLRRDLIDTATNQRLKVAPRYYGLNIVSDYPELAELVYDVKSFSKDRIVFESIQRNRRITKTYSLEGGDAPYCIDLEIKIEGENRGLWLTTGVPDVEYMTGAAAPTLKFRITRNNKSEVEQVKLPSETVSVSSLYPDWVCNSNGFLGLILDPIDDVEPGYKAQFVNGAALPSRLVEIDKSEGRFLPKDLPGYNMMLPIAQKNTAMKFRVFAGPFAENILKTVDARFTDKASGDNPDYIACQSFHGWFSFISEPFARFLFILMKFFYSVTHSWAFSIILLTVALRLMLYPLNAWSMKSMRRMQQIGPEVTAIQDKYKKDPKKAQLEVMTLYRSRGVNPLSGCFPILIQMPFLIGMFDLLKSTFELRGAVFIPGWIDDLASPDVLFTWSYPIFFIGKEFHLLPILLGCVMFVQQRFTSTLPADPSLMTDQQRQQKMMGNMMTVLFAVMFYKFPSGLNLYWLSSMLLGVLQQWFTNRQLDKVGPPKVEVLPKEGKGKKFKS